LPAFEPALQFARRLGPLLAAGGACVAKPPSQAPRSILRLAELALEAGVPAGLVNVVCGSGNEAGEGIVAHPGIRWIAFAGSTEVGLRVGAAAIAAGKRAQLSLGSSNAAIALGDLFLSDKARAGRAARALFDIHRPAWRAARLFTQESSSPATLDALVAAAQGLRVGDPLDPSVDIGPMPSARHLAIAQAQARQALAEKGRPRIDAAAFSLPARGFYIAPQIVADFSTCSGLRQQEALGPLVAECSFKYPRHAASGANATPFGQTFYVWSEDRERGLRLAAQLECGRALVGADEPFAGSGLQARLDAGMDEFGPAKQSGLGAEGALAWLRFFSCTHAVIDAAGPS
jgi:acyl-CoA reductase-like NAD-dependent aldehyde dehydrogenase